jgi:hypothetical protein
MKNAMGLLFFSAAACIAQPIVLKTSTILDGRGHVLRNQEIVIEGERIARVADARDPAAYDLSGLTVMPGWIDTHVHIGYHFNANNRFDDGGRDSKETPQQIALRAEANAYATLRAGFTTVQSLGQQIDGDLRGLINSETLPGPRILTSLRAVTEKTGTPDQIRSYVRKMHDDGADVIKLFATASIRDGGKQTMTDQQVQATCGEARALGMRSVVHAHAPGGARAAVLAGCTSIEHGAFLDDATLQMIADHGLYFDPNFLVLHNYLDNKPKFLGIGQLQRRRLRLHGKRRADDGHGSQESHGAPREDHLRHRCGSGRTWTQCRRIYLPCPRWRPAGHGRDRERDVAGRGVAKTAGQDRYGRSRHASRPGRGARQPAGRHHRGAQRGVRHEGRPRLPQ